METNEMGGRLPDVASTVKDYLTVQTEGKRRVRRKLSFITLMSLYL